MLTSAALGQGFILLGPSLRPIAYNLDAVRILAFPTKPDCIKQVPLFLYDKIRSNLLNGGCPEIPEFVRECKAGRRTYTCRAFHLDCHSDTGLPTPISFAISLERHGSNAAVLSDMAQHFALTIRECETVTLLLEGLTSKEIANRMQISPNTVKAFLRLVMVKMDVTTRSGVVGKALLGLAH